MISRDVKRRLARHLAQFRSFLWTKLRVFPAVGAVVSLMAGILGATCFTTSFPTPVVFFPLALTTLVLFVSVSGRSRVALGAMAVLGFGLMWRHFQVLEASSACGTLCDWHRVSVRAVNLSPGSPADGPATNGTRRIDIGLSEIRTADTTTWQPCNGSLVAYLGPCPSPPSYGAQIELDGLLCPPEDAPFPGAFDYSLYLRARGITHILRVEGDLRILRADAVGWRRVPALALHFRDWCAGRLVEQIRPVSAQGLLLAMVFGLRQCLEYGTSERYLRSGAIHIFAVSGLHVGIVGLLIGGMLRVLRLPFRWRAALLPVILAIYILMTGCSASSVRAWLMITIWSLSHALLLPPVPLNSVAFAAMILLILNPAGLFLAGFQFTFLIVAVLILGWPVVGHITEAMEERSRWRPRSRETFTHTIGATARRRSLRLVGVGILAWLGSAMLVAHTNSLFIANALVTNMVLGMIASCVLALAAPKILLGTLGLRSVAYMVGAVLRFLAGLADCVADVGSLAPGSTWVPAPPAWLTLVYYGFLFMGLSVIIRRPRFGMVCFAVCGALLLAVFVNQPDLPPGGVTVLTGGDARRSVLILERPGCDPVLINSGPRSAAAATAVWLRRRGYDAIDALILTDSDWTRASGTADFLDRTPIRTLVVPDHPSSARYTKDAVEWMTENGRRVRYSNPDGSTALGTVTVVHNRFGSSDWQTTITSKLPGPDTVVIHSGDPSGRQVLHVRSNGREASLVANMKQRQQFLSCTAD